MNMTPEDDAIVHKLNHAPFMAWLIECRDRVDYRAMMAREVYSEREWRIHDRAVTPIDVQACDNLHAWQPERFMNLREYIERINGETL
jgi:hypothetical protein